jgi:hypothetical protein
MADTHRDADCHAKHEIHERELQQANHHVWPPGSSAYAEVRSADVVQRL